MGSYPTVSPLPDLLGAAVCFLWHFPWGRPRRTLSGTVFPWSPDFPPRRPFALAGAAVRPTDAESNGVRGGAAVKGWATKRVGWVERSETHRGHLPLDGRVVRSPGGDRGFVFQSDNLLPWRSVFDNAMIGPEVAGRAGPEEKSRPRDLLKLVGLEGFEHYFARQLSGGMRQRVNLARARALAIDPEILLMDEPFSALDAQSREIMQTELLRIWEQGRKTVLFVTHQIDEAVFLVRRGPGAWRGGPAGCRRRVAIALPRPRTARREAHARNSSRCVDRIWTPDRGRRARQRDRGARVRRSMNRSVGWVERSDTHLRPLAQWRP